MGESMLNNALNLETSYSLIMEKISWVMILFRVSYCFTFKGYLKCFIKHIFRNKIFFVNLNFQELPNRQFAILFFLKNKNKISISTFNILNFDLNGKKRTYP